VELSDKLIKKQLMKLSLTLLAIAALNFMSPFSARAFTIAGTLANSSESRIEALYLVQSNVSLESYIEAGMAKYEKGDYQGSIEQFTRAIEINPQVAELYLFRGISYQEIGDQDKALADASKAISIQPDLAIAYELRGFVYSSANDLQMALTDFQKAAEIYQKQGDTDSYQRVSQTIDKIGGNSRQ
jgi:tetratricopeptide (TPR) repeat protein